MHRRKIGNILILPGGCIALSYTAAGFRKPRIANAAVIPQKLSRSRTNRFGSGWRRYLCDPLIALAMVIGANVKIRMCFAAVPAADFVRIESLTRWLAGM